MEAKTEHTETLPQIKNLKRLLSELKEVQWRIEEVAHTPGNEPARNLFDNRMQPAMDGIYTMVTSMIDLEKLEDGEGGSRQMLAAMADFRGSFTRSQATLGNLVTSDTSEDEVAFLNQAGIAKQRLKDLTDDSDLLIPEQKLLLNRLKTEFPLFVTLSDEIIKARKSPEWNIANAILHNEAVPISRQISDILSEMASQQSRLMVAGVARMDKLSRVATASSFFFVIFMAVSAWIVS